MAWARARARARARAWVRARARARARAWVRARARARVRAWVRVRPVDHVCATPLRKHAGLLKDIRDIKSGRREGRRAWLGWG